MRLTSQEVEQEVVPKRWTIRLHGSYNPISRRYLMHREQGHKVQEICDTRPICGVTRNNNPNEASVSMVRLKFSLRAWLLFTGLLAASIGWWCSWPNRTVRAFVFAVENHDSESLASICPGQDVYEDFRLGGPHLELDCSVIAKTRTVSDVLFCRNEFTIRVLFVGKTYWGKPHETSFMVRVERGRVLPVKPAGLQHSSSSIQIAML